MKATILFVIVAAGVGLSRAAGAQSVMEPFPREAHGYVTSSTVRGRDISVGGAGASLSETPRPLWDGTLPLSFPEVEPSRRPGIRVEAVSHRVAGTLQKQLELVFAPGPGPLDKEVRMQVSLADARMLLTRLDRLRGEAGQWPKDHKANVARFLTFAGLLEANQVSLALRERPAAPVSVWSVKSERAWYESRDLTALTRLRDQVATGIAALNGG